MKLHSENFNKEVWNHLVNKFRAVKLEKHNLIKQKKNFCSSNLVQKEYTFFSFRTTHEFLFGALAELVDNAR